MDGSDNPRLVEMLHLSNCGLAKDVWTIKVCIYVTWSQIRNVPSLIERCSGGISWLCLFDLILCPTPRVRFCITRSDFWSALRDASVCLVVCWFSCRVARHHIWVVCATPVAVIFGPILLWLCGTAYFRKGQYYLFTLGTLRIRNRLIKTIFLLVRTCHWDQ